MDILFTKLLSQIDALLTVNKNIDNHPLSKIGEKHKVNGSLKKRKILWNKYLKEIQNNNNQLKKFLPLYRNDFQDRTVLNIRLAFWRTLSKRLGEGGYPVWSQDYYEIKRILGEISKIRIKIDKKYKLS